MSPLDLVVLVTLAVVTVWRLPSALLDHKQRALWATFLFWLVARIVSIPSVSAAMDSAGPVDRPSLLTKHLMGVASSVVALRFIAYISDQDKVRSWRGRRRVALATAVSVALCVLFLLTSDPIHGSLELLNIKQSPSLMTVGYWMILECYIGWALATAAWLFYRVANQAAGRWLRYGTLVMAAGAALDLLYATVVVAVLLLRLVGIDPTAGALRQPLATLQLVAILMMVAGSGVPALGTLSCAVRRMRHYRQLLPLWQALTQQFPDIVLNDGPGAGLWHWGNVRLALYRRVIEVRDGMLSVRTYLPEGGHDRAQAWVAQSRLVGDEAEATIEACCLSLAMLARNRGLPEVGANGQSRRGGAHLDEEVRWLLLVTAAIASQLVVNFSTGVLEETGAQVSDQSPAPAPTPSGSCL